MAIHTSDQQQGFETLTVFGWDKIRGGYATDQLQKRLVHLSLEAVPIWLHDTLRPGSQIRCTVQEEATSVKMAAPDEKIFPSIRWVGAIKEVRRCYVIIVVPMHIAHSLQLPQDSVLGHRSQWSAELSELIEQGTNMVGREVAFDLGEFWGKTVAKNVTLTQAD